MITVNDVTYRYPRQTTPALENVSFSVPAGQLVAVLGANGAGKSTLCYTVTGFVPHFYRGEMVGQVIVDSVDVGASSLAELAGKVGLIFPNPFNQITGARFSVREEVAFGLENLGVPREEMEDRVAATLAQTDLGGVAERSPFALSGGQQQRLAIASILVMQPPVLVLDEPTAQLDPAGTRELFALLRSLADDGTTIVLATHKLEWTAVYADRALLLSQGRLVDDRAPDALLTRADLKAFGLRPTRYTQVARAAAARGLTPAERPLPVTLNDAQAYFC